MNADTRSTADCRVIRFPAGAEETDRLAVEEPLEIRVNGEPLAVTMRTPGHDGELAAGFCFTEGVIDDPDDLERVEPCAIAEYGNVVDVVLTDNASVRRRGQLLRARRELYLSSSCGLCGTRSIDRLARRVEPIGCDFTVSPDVLDGMPAAMIHAQDAFGRTGGIHAAALFAADGRLKFLHEDVGRHNAVDKIIGGSLFGGQLPGHMCVLLLSGRASFELIQKAARAGIPFVAAVGAPSSLAVETATRFGMTLIGFLREGRFNVYSGTERVGKAHP